MNNVITITGSIGSGKSTVAKQLSKMLGYKLYEGGKKFREIAESRNIDILKLNMMADTEKSIDDEIDNWLKSLNGKSNIIVDSRLGWHFVQPSFKVYLQVSEFTAVDRIYGDTRIGEETPKDKEELFKEIVLRKQEESLRFKKIYGVDLHNTDNYDLVINTENKSISEIINTILVRRLSGVKANINSGNLTKVMSHKFVI